MVVRFVPRVFLFTFRMVYMILHSVSLGDFFAKEWSSGDMCHKRIIIKTSRFGVIAVVNGLVLLIEVNRFLYVRK